MPDEPSTTPPPDLDTPPEPVQPIPEPQTAPDSAEATGTQPSTSTAQTARNEPLPPPPPPSPLAQRLSSVAGNAAKGVRKRKKLDKILQDVAKRGSVTNDHVEKLLHVSDATATRYLQTLENEGKIKQVGTTGKSVKYARFN